MHEILLLNAIVTFVRRIFQVALTFSIRVLNNTPAGRIQET